MQPYIGSHEHDEGRKEPFAHDSDSDWRSLEEKVLRDRDDPKEEQKREEDPAGDHDLGPLNSVDLVHSVEQGIFDLEFWVVIQ